MLSISASLLKQDVSTPGKTAANPAESEGKGAEIPFASLLDPASGNASLATSHGKAAAETGKALPDAANMLPGETAIAAALDPSLEITPSPTDDGTAPATAVSAAPDIVIQTARPEQIGAKVAAEPDKSAVTQTSPQSAARQIASANSRDGQAIDPAIASLVAAPEKTAHSPAPHNGANSVPVRGSQMIAVSINDTLTGHGERPDGLPIAGQPRLEAQSQRNPGSPEPARPVPPQATAQPASPLPATPRAPIAPQPAVDPTLPGPVRGAELLQVEFVHPRSERAPASKSVNFDTALSIEPGSAQTAGGPAVGGQTPPALSALQPAASNVTAAPVTTAAHSPAPHDFGALIDRLVQARDAAAPMAGASVRAVMSHGDFGAVTMRFDPSGANMHVALSSADPTFAPIARSAIAADAALADDQLRANQSGGNPSQSGAESRDSQTQAQNGSQGHNAAKRQSPDANGSSAADHREVPTDDAERSSTHRSTSASAGEPGPGTARDLYI